MKSKEFLEIVKAAFHKWIAHKAPLRAAALSFFTIFPLPSLLLIMISIFALVFGQAGAFQIVIRIVNTVAGSAVGGLVGRLLESAVNPLTSLLIAVVSIPFTVVGAIGAFGVLQDSMNTIWETAPPKHRNMKERVKYNLIPFLLISGLTLTVIIWAGVTSVLFNFITLIFKSPLAVSSLLTAAGAILSFLLATLLFAIIYKIVPDTKIAWNDVTLASVITALLFAISNFIFKVYIQVFSSTSLYGTAGSVMLLLLWIYLMAQFLLFGAEFSKIYADTKASLNAA